MADGGDGVPAGLDGILGFHIRLAHGAVFRHFNETFGAIGLTQKQTSVLWVVADAPGVSQSAVARLLQMDRATMMAITNGLAARGFLERRMAPGDRRRQALHLTAAGQAALAAARAAVAEHEGWLKGRFTEGEVGVLVALLRRVHSG